MTPRLLVLVLAVVPLMALDLPDDNFYQIIWQAPSSLCRKHDSSLDFNVEQYHIILNPRDKYDGEFTAIFYHFGRYPMYAFSNPGKEDNGGIPQKGDESSHLDKATNDIRKEIPSVDFGGVAVLNQEEWRPLFIQNFGVKAIYQDKSIENYVEHHNESDYTKIIEGAIAEFDEASLRFSVDSLKFGHSMRKKGKWGYYAFPYCYNAKVPVAERCSEFARGVTDRLKPMWDATTAVLPSIYLWHKYDAINRFNFIFSQVEEGVRAASLSDTYTPVYVYTKMIYKINDHYSKEDIYATLRIPADFGVEGVIVWGTDVEFNDKKNCRIMDKLINKLVGPYAKEVNMWANDCAAKRCNNHGRCVHRGTLDSKYRMKMHRKTEKEFKDFSITNEYKCVCVHGYSGSSCKAAPKKR